MPDAANPAERPVTSPADREKSRAHARPLGRAELLAIMAFWTFMASLSAANALLDPRGRGLQPVLTGAPIVLAFVESYLWAALTPAIFLLSSRLSLERSNWLLRALVLLLVGLVIAIVVDSSLAYLRFHVFFTPRRRPPVGVWPWSGIAHLWFLNDLIVYMAVVAAGFARDYFLRYRARQDESIRLQTHAARLEAQLAEARLAALRTQLDPHFLFNTLHAVSALVERDPTGVRRMIARLSDLLRHSLEGATQQEVPVEREIALVREYLEIMQIRFEGRLTTEVRVAQDAAEALVPSLVLQPLVENAVKHGVSRMDGGGWITITAERDGASLVLRVRDNGPGVPDASARAGVGLRNTRERLEQLYGPAHALTLGPAEGGGAVAEVRLPYHTRRAGDLPETA